MQAGKDYIGVITPFFCHDGYGNYLFYRRSSKAKDNHDMWDCSGGTMHFGEQPEQAMRRKLLSQYNVNPVSFVELPAHSVLIEIDGDRNHWLAIPFIVRVNRDDIAIGDPEKMAEISWHRLEDLPQPLHPGADIIIKTFGNTFASLSQP